MDEESLTRLWRQRRTTPLIHFALDAPAPPATLPTSTMIGVSIKILQNWGQGRREPEGPAKALLRVVEREPEAVLSALHA